MDITEHNLTQDNTSDIRGVFLERDPREYRGITVFQLFQINKIRSTKQQTVLTICWANKSFTRNSIARTSFSSEANKNNKIMLTIQNINKKSTF